MPDFGELFDEPGTSAYPGAVDVTAGGVPSPQEDIGSVLQGLPPEAQEAYKPPATPQEKEKRKQGWLLLAERFSSNPNLQRAFMLAGATMAQPIQPGQNSQGAFANSLVVGSNAYQLGEQADYARGKDQRTEARAERGLQLQEAESKERVKTAPVARAGIAAGTAHTEAGTKLLHATMEDAVASSRANRKKLELGLSEAEKDVALRDLERDNKAIQEFAKRPSLFRQAEQEMELNDAKIAEARAKAKKGSFEVAALEGLTDQEKLEYFTKSGRFDNTGTGATGSAQVKLREYWGAAYERIKADKPDSPEIKGLSRDEYVGLRETEGKGADPATQIARLTAAGITAQTHPDIYYPLLSQIRATANRRAGIQPGAERKTVTRAEVAATAKSRGVSEAVIIEALKKKGISVGG